MSSGLKNKKAIVVGSGAAGLYCAASLASIFNSVMILEKDTGVPDTTPRKGVAQGAHLHNILAAGLWLLEQIYPGITRELLARGAAPLTIGIDQHIYDSGCWLPNRSLGMDVVALSRPLLDKVLYEKTLQFANVECIHGLKVESLCLEAGAVTGVNIQTREGTHRHMDADLVVDASGVSAALWKALAHELKLEDQVETIDSKIVYCSAIVKKPEQWRATRENILVMPEPTQNAGGALIDIEGDQWMVSLHGRHGVVPPSEPAAWKAFSQQLAVDAVWQRIRDAELVTPVRTFNKPKSSIRQFDRMPAVPIGYFPVGDLISSVNPIFGQGMTVAWGHAYELVRALRSQPPHAAWPVYASQALSWSRTAWSRSAAYDRLFLKAEAGTEKSALELDLVKKLAVAKIRSVTESEDAHRQMIIQAHMLDKIRSI